MSLGLLDLHLVTDQLVQQLKDCTAATRLWNEQSIDPFTINWSGLAPDAARAQSGCQGSMYLFHVAADAFNRNTYPQGGPAQRTPRQPLALTLHYLLTAYSTSYIEEQQAMSIALKCFHEHPVVTASVPSGDQEFALTLEAISSDDLGRLWQAFSSSMRVSAVYRVGVVFMEAPPPLVPKPVTVPPSFQAQTDYAARISGAVTAASDGRVTVTVASAGFAPGSTLVQVRPLSAVTLPETLQETPADPPAAGQFRILNASTLDVAIPSATTPKRRYVLHIRPAPGKDAVELWLDVP